MQMNMSEGEAGQASPGCVAMQVAQHNVEVFKKPLHPAPTKKKKVLDEETYVQKVEQIIERDFFPDLENLKEKLEYLEAKEANDVAKLREFFLKYSRDKDTPLQHNVQYSPATFETPDAELGNRKRCSTPSLSGQAEEAVEGGSESSTKGCDSHEEISLDEFLSAHTSEDNASFEQLMKENEKRFRAKYAWMFEAGEKHNKEHMPNLALPTTQQQAQASILAITGTSVDKDTRPKQVENWHFETFNPVMFVPEGIPMTQEKMLELSKLKKREVSLNNTRFEGNPFRETLSQAAMLEASAVQASKKEGKVGVDGKELGKDTPKVNGYAFVTAPSPMPGVDASPLMTWGEVEGTPFQLDGSQTPLLKKQNAPGPAYRIPQVPSRDRIGLRLAEQASQKHRNKKNKAMLAARHNLGTPGTKLSQQSSLERVTSMSPAAQRLLTAKLGVRHGTDKALRASYTPSPSVRHGSATPGVTTPNLAYLSSSTRGNTPKIAIPKRPSTTAGGLSEGEIAVAGLTDNLLDLPKRSRNVLPESVESDARQTAADFF